MKPHKHAELIKAWADGAEIQFFQCGFWQDTICPTWNPNYEWRIKSEPKPDVVKSSYILLNINGDIWQDISCTANVKFTFDGETGKLKTAEVL